MCLKAVSLFFVFFSSVKFTSACNGYNLKVDYIKPCTADSVVIPKNMDFAFDSKCNLVLSGCVEMTKTLKTSKATYELTKSPMPTMTGDVDLCSLFGNKKKLFVTKQVFEAYGLPKSCPVPAKKYCVNGKQLISIDSYKNKLGMALGSVVTKLNVDHEDAGKTCVDIKMTVSKKK